MVFFPFSNGNWNYNYEWSLANQSPYLGLYQSYPTVNYAVSGVSIELNQAETIAPNQNLNYNQKSFQNYWSDSNENKERLFQNLQINKMNYTRTVSNIYNFSQYQSFFRIKIVDTQHFQIDLLRIELKKPRNDHVLSSIFVIEGTKKLEMNDSQIPEYMSNQAVVDDSHLKESILIEQRPQNAEIQPHLESLKNQCQEIDQNLSHLLIQNQKILQQILERQSFLENSLKFLQSQNQLIPNEFKKIETENIPNYESNFKKTRLKPKLQNSQNVKRCQHGVTCFDEANEKKIRWSLFSRKIKKCVDKIADTWKREAKSRTIFLVKKFGKSQVKRTSVFYKNIRDYSKKKIFHIIQGGKESNRDIKK